MRSTRYNITLFCLVTTLLGVLSGCDKTSNGDKDNAEVVANQQVPSTIISDPELDEHTQFIWESGTVVFNELDAALAGLDSTAKEFLAEPSAETLTQTQEQWRIAHRQWQSLQPLLAIGTSSADLFVEITTWQYAIDAWPIQPGYIDYFDQYEHSGIVNDIAIPIAATQLRQQHGLTDTSDIAIGFHAMEYLLFGQNKKRPVTDFEKVNSLTDSQKQAGLRIIDLPQNRRRDYLQLMIQLLTDDVKTLQKHWQSPNGIFYQHYSQLLPGSRAQLLLGAGDVFLGQFLEEMRIANSNNEENENSNAIDDSATHLTYSGENPDERLAIIGTLNTLYLSDETGVGRWLFDESTVASVSAAFSAALTAEENLSHEKTIALMQELQTVISDKQSDIDSANGHNDHDPAE